VYPPLIFDCDGVLIDSEAVYLTVELDALAALGLRYDRAAYVRTFMGLAPERWRRELSTDVESRTGAPLPVGFFAELDATLDRAMHDHLRPVSGAREAVVAVDGPRCVASSTPGPRLAWKLARTGLDELFGPHVYSADAVDRGKPAPDLFWHAAAGMRAAASRCVVIEDSANGVMAGVAAGMTVLGFAGGGHCVDGHADMLRDAGAAAVIADFADLDAGIAAVQR
jgi:HAD superfamily hydrolase (TIGR01509 family)